MNKIQMISWGKMDNTKATEMIAKTRTMNQTESL